jgi:hypothetical protein
MKTTIDPKLFAVVCGALQGSEFKTATKYLTPKSVVRATWQFKPHSRNPREEMRVTYGAPNYLETVAIKRMLKDGVTFPVKPIIFKAWPKRRKGA